MTIFPIQEVSMSTDSFLGLLKDWDPRADQVLLQPERNEPGYWIGCPGVFGGKHTYFTYRERRPRNLDFERGWKCGVKSLSEEGASSDLWTVRKDELETASMERFALNYAGGQWELYLSFVDPADDRWRVDVVRADSIENFDVASRENVLTAASTETEGVKDPFIYREGDKEYMFLSVAQAPEISDPEAAHGTQDIFNTGHTLSSTGLAVREAGGDWVWRGIVLEPGDDGSWDQNTRRINSVLKLTDGYLAFYDGKESHESNYEEKTGLAVSRDLLNWNVISGDEPFILSDSESGSLRYLDYRIASDSIDLIYEITRPDTSHEARMHRVSL